MQQGPDVRAAAALLAALLLGACGSGPGEPPKDPAASAASAAGRIWTCEDGRTVEAAFMPRDGHATVTVDGVRHELPAQPAASGARYADGDAEFWSKGGKATLFADGASTTCFAEG